MTESPKPLPPAVMTTQTGATTYTYNQIIGHLQTASVKKMTARAEEVRLRNIGLRTLTNK